jgi:hypothetical protein
VLFVILCEMTMQPMDIGKAVKRNDFEKVREILKENPDSVREVDADGVTPLHCMCFEMLLALTLRGLFGWPL